MNLEINFLCLNWNSQKLILIVFNSAVDEYKQDLLHSSTPKKEASHKGRCLSWEKLGRCKKPHHMFEAIDTNARNKACLSVFVSIYVLQINMHGMKRQDKNPDSHPLKPKTRFAFCAINFTKKKKKNCKNKANENADGLPAEGFPDSCERLGVEVLNDGGPTETFHVPPQAQQNVCDRTFINSSQIKSNAAGARQIIGWESSWVIDSKRAR